MSIQEAIDYALTMLEKDGKVVIKRDEIAAGKGVVIAESKAEAEETIVKFFATTADGDLREDYALYEKHREVILK